jgi:regulator of replication initiation timing
MGKNYRELSKRELGNVGDNYGLDQVNAGSLQRIADAAEMMAQNYIETQEMLLKVNRQNSALRLENKKLKESRAGHKAAFTKLKNKTEVKSDE